MKSIRYKDYELNVRIILKIPERENSIKIDKDKFLDSFEESVSFGMEGFIEECADDIGITNLVDGDENDITYEIIETSVQEYK